MASWPMNVTCRPGSKRRNTRSARPGLPDSVPKTGRICRGDLHEVLVLRRARRRPDSGQPPRQRGPACHRLDPAGALSAHISPHSSLGWGEAPLALAPAPTVGLPTRADAMRDPADRHPANTAPGPYRQERQKLGLPKRSIRSYAQGRSSIWFFLLNHLDEKEGTYMAVRVPFLPVTLLSLPGSSSSVGSSAWSARRAPSIHFHPSERLPCPAGHMPGGPDGASPQEGIC
jgi:hypothetical protein